METGNTTSKEIEVLEFKSGENVCGIYIADIKEILPYEKPKPIPNSHPCIEGIVKPRDFLITVIDLLKYIKADKAQENEKESEMIIVTGFNDLNIAFHVDHIIGINRVLKSEIEVPDKKTKKNLSGVIAGVVKVKEKPIEILDYKKIINEMNPDIQFN